MSCVKNPDEKKRLSLARDHRTLAEYPKGHRHGWPRAKAGINRQFRRAARRALAANAAADTDEAALSETMTAMPHPMKWPVLMLAQAISDRMERRSDREFSRVGRKAAQAAAMKAHLEAAAEKAALAAAAARLKRAKRFKRRRHSAAAPSPR